MTERDTKTITTPAGKTAKLLAYLTARERNIVRNAMLALVKMDPNKGIAGAAGEAAADMDKLPGDMVVQAVEEGAIKAVVVEYDGSADGILDRLLDASPEEYDAVCKAANEVYAGPKV